MGRRGRGHLARSRHLMGSLARGCPVNSFLAKDYHVNSGHVEHLTVNGRPMKGHLAKSCPPQDTG